MRVKNNPDAVPNLLTQVEAYDRNYFDVGNLIEDSKTKADALDTVATMETQMKEVHDAGVQKFYLRLLFSSLEMKATN